MKMNKKGFSLVELLAVIVIIGSIAFVAIAAVLRYVDGSKKEKIEQDRKNVSMAAQLYLQSNRELYPKLIGDETRVSISELKKKRYLKEDVTNAAGESCMEKSFVRVYKLNDGEYSYTTYFYCGNDEVPNELDIPEPAVVDFKFTGVGNSESWTYNDVKDAKFSFTMKGAADKDDVGIYSYSYAIYVKSNDPDAVFTQVYDSESIKGGLEPTLKINSKNLSSYMNITGVTTVRVDVSIVNELGAKKTFPFSSGEFEDKKAPKCGNTEGEATSDDDWINKKSFGDKDTIVSGARSYPARISVDCNDESGSGCKRDRFTRSWPNDYESASGIDYNYGTRWGYVELEDNASEANTTKCYVKPNIDVRAPEVKVTIYKATPEGGNGEQVYQYTVKDADEVNATMPEGTIAAKNYSGVVGSGSEKWLNKANFPNGIIIDVEMEDNLFLYSYEWNVNNPLVPGGTGNAKVASSVSAANGEAEQNGGTVYKNTFPSPTDMIDNPTNDEELAKAEHGTLTGSVKGLKLTREGKRYGRLVVCDKAGNCTTVHIYANIDRTSPSVPNISFKKQSSGGSYTAATSSNYQNTANWTKEKVYSYIIEQQKDNNNTANAELSGWEKFTYSYLQQDASKAKYNWLSAVTGTANSYDWGIGFAINDEGISRIKYRSCDKANNCSGYSEEKYVKIDLTKPTCGVKTTYAGTTEPNAAGWLKAGQSVTLTHTCADAKSTDSGCNATNDYNKQSKTYSTDMNVTNAGAVDVGKGGNVVDYAGNVSNECPKNVTVKIDTEKPTCDTKMTYTGTTGPNSAGWLKKGETVTLSHTCTDPKKNNVASGCDTNNTKNKQKTLYNDDINTTKAGANGLNNGGTVMDIAGNESIECPLKTVKIDYVAPTCTAAISYPNGGTTNGWLGSHGNDGGKKTAVVTQRCTDNANNGVSSGCPTSGYKSHTYDTEMNTTKAGAAGVSKGGGKIKDIAGNSSDNCPANKTVKIDYTPPKCTPSINIGSSTGTAYTSGTWTNKNVVITAKCTDKGQVKSGCDTETFSKYTSAIDASVRFIYGEKATLASTPKARATDKAGNYSNCSASYHVRIDKTPPIASCTISGQYTTDSNSNIKVTSNSKDAVEVSVYNHMNAFSDIKTTTYSIEGGSYSTVNSKKLACGGSKRNATASVKVVDKAGNSDTATCGGNITIPSCCSSTGYWVNGSTCYKDRKVVSCGGGHYDHYKYSTLNGQLCQTEYEKGSACATASCCGMDNLWGCPYVIPCRSNTGTWVYGTTQSDHSGRHIGVVRNNVNGVTDHLTLLATSGSYYVIFSSGYLEFYESNRSQRVMIMKNCVGPPGSSCNYGTCPG